MKRILVLFLVLILAFGALSCKKRKNTESTSESVSASESRPSWDAVKGDAVELKIYVDESNIYGAYVAGSGENAVKEAIEKKFYEDTGNAIDLKIMYNTHDTFSSNFGGVMSTGQWDAAVSYLGQAGLEETVLNQPNIVMDLSNLLAEHGSNIYEAIDQQAMYATTTYEGDIIGIPSVNKSKIKGILVRKDYMLLAGYTDNKQEAASSNGTLKYCQTIDDFTDMLRAMKSKISACTIPLIGNPYDIEFAILAGACGTAGYQYKAVNYNSDGSVKEVVPGWLSDGYQKMLNYEYLWRSEGLWEADNTIRDNVTRLNDFSNGKTGVYCVDTNILNLINVTRQVKAVNPNAQFTVLQPLDAVDAQGNAIEGSGAFAEASRTTDCLIVNSRSDNAELIVKYLDWMYSDVKNYELCAYGIEGKHWVDAGEGFYTYPEQYKEIYLTSRPYSGVFALLHNDEFAYRLFDSYSQEELGWIAKVESAKTIKNATDGMLFHNMPATEGSNFTLAESHIYERCAVPTWNGSSDPAVTYPTESAAYRTQAGDYIVWLTRQYNLYMADRA
ncbi:MAG: hypothetical protein IJW64_07220 [Clostridia bacterium]|nr:hypothetical protein [Clostridia bacterium]